MSFALCLTPQVQAKPPGESPASSSPDAAATDPYAVLDQLGQSLAVVENEYFEAPDQGRLLDNALRGMVEGLDPHSNYFNSSDFELFEGSTKGKFGGIGVEVEFEAGEIIVIAPIDGSPADRAGIVPGDEIVAIDGHPLASEKPQDVVKKMRGEIGTELRLTLRSPDKKSLRDVVLKREQIAVASVLMQSMVHGVAYFRIKAFQEGTHQEFLEALAQARQAGPVSGILLDLRNNPGGLVREAAALADEFLTHGEIFSTRHRGQVQSRTMAHRGGAWTTGPVVVLINEYSASAAELVAGALKDAGRAQVVGARSFGKGSVQSLIPLGHGGALKLTTALYYTPSGVTTQAIGITPHLAIDPGYIQGPSVRVLREEDLEGHLADASAPPAPAKTDAPSSAGDEAPAVEPRGAPPTTDELHLGVARTPPENPETSGDIALRAAYRLVLGLPPEPRANLSDAR